MPTWVTITLSAIGGLGIGTIVQSIVQFFLSRRSSDEQRRYQEKKESYLNLLSALRDVSINENKENLMKFAVAQASVELFGSSHVAKAVQQFKETLPGNDQKMPYQLMIDEMRRDLQTS